MKKEVLWLKRDTIKEEYYCIDGDAQKMMSIISKNNLFCYLADTSKFESLGEMKNILVGFVEKIIEFIKNADLYMDDFRYVGEDDLQIGVIDDAGKLEEKALDIPENIMDQIRLVSTYKGVLVPSMIFDSTGTKKIAAIASYVIEALEEASGQEAQEKKKRLTTIVVIIIEMMTICLIICFIEIWLMQRRYRKKSIQQKFLVYVKCNLWIWSRLGYRRKEEETLEELQKRIIQESPKWTQEREEWIFIRGYQEYLYRDEAVSEAILDQTMMESAFLLEWLRKERKWQYIMVKLRSVIQWGM